MIPSIDLREDCRAAQVRGREAELRRAARAVSAVLPGDHEVRPRGLHAATGTPRVLESAAAEPAEGSHTERALAHLRDIARALGDSAGGELEFFPDPAVRRTSAGTRIVHLHQHVRGVPVFEATRSVVFDRRGAVRRVTGEHVPVSDALDPRPSLAATGAVDAAARCAQGDGASRAAARVIASFPLPSRPTVLRKARLAQPATAALVLFYRAPVLELAWRVTLDLPGGEDAEVIVAARGKGAGEILYCRPTRDNARARGSVFRTNPGEGSREPVDFPLPLTDYPLPAPSGLPSPFPGDWVAKKPATKGNNAAAYRGNTFKALKGKKRRGTVVFDPEAADGTDQRLLNAFYFCNFLHDFFYLLGFDEAAGNFQHRHATGAPGDGDALEVRIFDQVLDGGAAMRSRQDGRPGELELGFFAGSSHHTALDADVVFHEFTHGVSNRLVGGRHSLSPLLHPQSRALAEGTSDYFALTLQNFDRPAAEERLVFAPWSTGKAQGLRRHPYDERFPGHFGLLGGDGLRRAHDAGEVWCATLLAMHRALGDALGSRRRGHRVGWQLVVDALQLMPAHANAPSFLDGRDALLDALDDLAAGDRLDEGEHRLARAALLATFLRFGMGPAAHCPDATFDGIVADGPPPSPQEGQP